MNLSKILLMLTICSLAFSISPATTQEEPSTQLAQTADAVDKKSLSSEQSVSSTSATTQETPTIPSKKKRVKRPVDPFRKEQEAEFITGASVKLCKI